MLTQQEALQRETARPVQQDSISLVQHQTDASIIWNSGDGLLTVRGFVDNLFDARNFRSLSAGGLGNNYMLTGTLLRTRSFGIDITRRFGEG